MMEFSKLDPPATAGGTDLFQVRFHKETICEY